MDEQNVSMMVFELSAPPHHLHDPRLRGSQGKDAHVPATSFEGTLRGWQQCSGVTNEAALQSCRRARCCDIRCNIGDVAGTPGFVRRRGRLE